MSHHTNTTQINWSGNKTEALTLFIKDKIFLGMPFSEYLKSLITPFNIIAAIIIAVGLPVTVIRFTKGLGSATNLSDTNPWGLWIGFDMLCGIALAAGGFVIGSAVYLFGLKDLHCLVRPAVLTGMLGYLFAVIGLMYDLGRPWRLPYPMVVSYGVTSVMFLVAWHLALYLTCLVLEFLPAAFEWAGFKKLREVFVRLTIGLTIFGAILATGHQAALGGLFLLAPDKVHPLWYSPLIPIFFFVSIIVAGITMIIFESMLSHRIFSPQISHHDHENFDRITVDLGRAAAVVLFTYFCIQALGVTHDNKWHWLATPYGYWFLVEILGFVLLPCFMFVWGARNNNAAFIRFTSVIAILGVILNRINISIIAFNWDVADKYYPHWMEYAVSITLVTTGILVFRWIVNRMPILWDHPDYEAH